MANTTRFYLMNLLLYSIAILFLCFYSTQANFLSILVPSVFAYLAFYFILVQTIKAKKLKEVLISIFLLKICILFSFPHLSDDIYRFWWDGYLSSFGFDPYTLIPTDVINKLQGEIFYPALQKYYPFLNSKNYITAYPLICQWVFKFSAIISGDNLVIFTAILKIIFLLADGMILFFLLRLYQPLNFQKENVLIYFGNPLCIVELNANLHFEIFLILFFIISVYFFNLKKYLSSGIHFGFSVVSKLTSLLWLPLFLGKSFWKKNSLIFLCGVLIPVYIFLLTLHSNIQNYQSSIGLYFQKFEFNSFLYGPLLYFFDSNEWYKEKVYINVVLTALFLLCYFSIVLISWCKNQTGFSFKSAWLILFCYLIFSTTVHPWYITPILLLSVVCYSKTGLAWGSLIILSYARYDPMVSEYDGYFIVLEYSLVLLLFISECKKRDITAQDLSFKR